jgi:ketosteroid isomerase-like protein
VRPDDAELVWRGLTAANDGDFETVLSLLADDVEVYSDPSTGNSGTYHGKDGYMEWATQWLEAWESFQIDIRELEPVGDDGILVTADQVAKGKGSGIEIGLKGVVYFFRVRDGLATRIALYMNREAAEEALGLG